MIELRIAEEPINSSGALSLLHAAVDELRRRYGSLDDGPIFDPDELTPPRGVFFVARHDGELAGGVGLRAIGERGAVSAEVKRLWVRPDLRRSGAATALMDAVEGWARAAGYRHLFLETGFAQPEALAFYPKSGWWPVDEFPFGAYSHHGASRFTKDL